MGDRICVADTDNELLHIFSCGHFYDIDRDTCISRPAGRSDYQLIFVTRGVVYFDGTDGREIAAPAGSIIVYKPYQPQTYRCKAEQDSAYYWIHFNGSFAENLLAHSDMTISEIAVAVGVGDSMYFSKKFRSFTGVSPSEYRARKNSE